MRVCQTGTKKEHRNKHTNQPAGEGLEHPHTYVRASFRTPYSSDMTYDRNTSVAALANSGGKTGEYPASRDTIILKQKSGSLLMRRFCFGLKECYI